MFAVISDLHFDSHRPKIAAKVIGQLVDMLEDDIIDWIIFAGDLSTGGLCYDAKRLDYWRMLMEPIADRVIFVPGNHDYFGGTFEVFWNNIHKMNFAHALNNETIEVDGLIIYGGTLWFEKPIVDMAEWCDYEWIMGDCKRQIYRASAEFKCNMPKRVDIVISHHLPSPRSIHPRYFGERTNCFFFNDCEELIRTVKPQWWVHGHTHDKLYYQFNKHTKIICNPFGYPSNDTGRYQIEVIEVNNV